MREQYSTQLAMAAGGLVLVANAVFALVQSPELLGFSDSSMVKSALAVPHSVDGRKACSSCHGTGGPEPYPLLHAGWSRESCLRCHVSGTEHPPRQNAEDTMRDEERKGDSLTPAETEPKQDVKEVGPKAPPPLPHPREGMESCLECHGLEGAHPFPENHAGRSEKKCSPCHPPAG